MPLDILPVAPGCQALTGVASGMGKAATMAAAVEAGKQIVLCQQGSSTPTSDWAVCCLTGASSRGARAQDGTPTFRWTTMEDVPFENPCTHAGAWA